MTDRTSLEPEASSPTSATLTAGTRQAFLPSEVDPTVFDEAFLRQLERLLLLMRSTHRSQTQQAWQHSLLRQMPLVQRRAVRKLTFWRLRRHCLRHRNRKPPPLNFKLTPAAPSATARWSRSFPTRSCRRRCCSRRKGL
jgi:hypothetical protein